MNKYKEAYKEEIVADIVDKYVKLEYSINSTKPDDSQVATNTLNQKLATLKYMKNLLRTITAEEDVEIDQRIEEGRSRFYDDDEE